jgi:hypothetical protein
MLLTHFVPGWLSPVRRRLKLPIVAVISGRRWRPLVRVDCSGRVEPLAEDHVTNAAASRAGELG